MWTKNDKIQIPYSNKQSFFKFAIQLRLFVQLSNKWIWLSFWTKAVTWYGTKQPQINELEHRNAIRKNIVSDERLDNCLQMQQVMLKLFHSSVQGQTWKFLYHYSYEHPKKQIPEKLFYFSWHKMSLCHIWTEMQKSMLYWVSTAINDGGVSKDYSY